MRFPFTSFGIAALCLAALPTGEARAESRELYVMRAKAGDVRVDGSLREWGDGPHGRLEVPGGASAEYWVAADDDALYLAARIVDPKVVRTKRYGRREDALVLHLGLPRRNGRYEDASIWCFAGVPGSIASRVDLPRGSSGKALAVEGPGDGGAVELEVRVPRAALPNGAHLFLARGALRLQDARGRGKPKSAATAKGAAGKLPALRIQGGSVDALANLRKARDVPAGRPRHDFVTDIGGGRMVRVLLLGKMVVLLGEGDHLTYRDLPVMGAADVAEARLQELTGGGAKELWLRLKQRTGGGERTLVQILGLESGSPQPIWSAEVAKHVGKGRLESKVEVEPGKRGRPPRVVLHRAVAHHLQPAHYREAKAADAAPILLPWEPVLTRSYAFDGKGFAKVDETSDPHHDPGATAAGAAPAAPAAPAARARRREPQGPPPPAGNAALLSAFREAQGIDPGVGDRFVRTVNLAGDRRRETLQVTGKHLVVVGEGYRGGRGYLYFELPVDGADDVLWLFTGDVTHDGRREIFVRVRRPIEDVKREVLLGYTFEGEGMRRIFQGEVRRARGADSVGNVVSLKPARKHYALHIDPGVARGWGDGRYPFAPDPPGDHAPLLLPWQDRAVRYRYDGKHLVPR